MEKLRSFRNKLLGLGALLSASLVCAQEQSSDPLGTLTTLNTNLGTVSTSVNALYVTIAGIALVITIGVIAVKMTKKPRSVG